MNLTAEEKDQAIRDLIEALLTLHPEALWLRLEIDWAPDCVANARGTALLEGEAPATQADFRGARYRAWIQYTTKEDIWWYLIERLRARQPKTATEIHAELIRIIGSDPGVKKDGFQAEISLPRKRAAKSVPPDGCNWDVLVGDQGSQGKHHKIVMAAIEAVQARWSMSDDSGLPPSP